jgi:hypothetical protein
VNAYLITFKDVGADNVIPMCDPRPPRTWNEFDLLLQLDSSQLPGISGLEFRTLFARCRACDLCVTRRTFEDHECGRPRENTNADQNAFDMLMQLDDWERPGISREGFKILFESILTKYNK